MLAFGPLIRVHVDPLEGLEPHHARELTAQVENDDDVPLKQYDKILFHPKNAIPVDFEADNQLFVVPVEDVVAVFRREEREGGSSEEGGGGGVVGIGGG